MSQHLIDTDIRIAECTRCGCIVFTAHSAGIRIAVDPELLDADAYRAAILEGRPCYDQRGTKLQACTPDIPRSLRIMGAHTCGAKAMDTTAIVEIPATPQKAPVTPGSEPDGIHLPPALEKPAQGHTTALVPYSETTTSPSLARRANPHRSRYNAGDARWTEGDYETDNAGDPRLEVDYGWPRCERCRELIDPRREYHTAIKHGTHYVWAMHDYPCHLSASRHLLRERDWNAIGQLSPENQAKPITNIYLPEMGEHEEDDSSDSRRESHRPQNA